MTRICFLKAIEDTVKAMFYGGDADYGPVQWFLTNDGVTIWFNQYDIAPYAAGPVTVEISFAEHAEWFEKQYESGKTSYVKELPEIRNGRSGCKRRREKGSGQL